MLIQRPGSSAIDPLLNSAATKPAPTRNPTKASSRDPPSRAGGIISENFATGLPQVAQLGSIALHPRLALGSVFWTSACWVRQAWTCCGPLASHCLRLSSKEARWEVSSGPLRGMACW